MYLQYLNYLSILRNSLIVIVIDACVCLLCGVCVFATLGSLAYSQNTDVSKYF